MSLLSGKRPGLSTKLLLAMLVMNLATTLSFTLYTYSRQKQAIMAMARSPSRASSNGAGADRADSHLPEHGASGGTGEALAVAAGGASHLTRCWAT